MPLHARVLTVELGPGMRAEGLALAERWTAGAATLPGFVDVWFFGDDDTGRYGYFSLWESREDAEGAADAIGPQVLEALLGHARSPPVVRIYEVYEPYLRRPKPTAGRAVLRARTPEARAALRGHGVVEVSPFPFRVGRDSRLDHEADSYEKERRANVGPPSNELFLVDAGERKHVSRNHFRIERDADGGYEIVDCASRCGLSVGERRLGPSAEERCPLLPGDTVIVGTPESRYIFQFLTVAETG